MSGGMHQPCEFVTPRDLAAWMTAIDAATAQMDVMLKNNMVLRNALGIIAKGFPGSHSAAIACRALNSAVDPVNANLKAAR